MQKIISKIFFNHITLVAQANNKVVEAVRRIYLHDMPQDGHIPNFDHRLGLEHGFLGKARTQPAGENDYFHRVRKTALAQRVGN